MVKGFTSAGRESQGMFIPCDKSDWGEIYYQINDGKQNSRQYIYKKFQFHLKNNKKSLDQSQVFHSDSRKPAKYNPFSTFLRYTVFPKWTLTPKQSPTKNNDFSKGGAHKIDEFWWVIFQRGEYTKPMGFGGWVFKGGSTQNRWALMVEFSKGGVHKTDGVWWVMFQRGEYTKPMGFDGFWKNFIASKH